jgi:hypothetical protein
MAKKQNKKPIIPLVIGGIVLVAIIGALFLKPSKQTSQQPEGTSELKADIKQEKGFSEGNPFKGSYKAAVALGIPMKCSYQVGGGEYKGVIKGDKFKGQMKNPNGQVGHMIMKDNCMYSWSEEMKDQGIKICDEEMDINAEDNQEEPTEEANMPDNLVCYPTAVSDSEFDLPTDVKFMDMANLMDSFGAIPDMKQ